MSKSNILDQFEDEEIDSDDLESGNESNDESDAMEEIGSEADSNGNEEDIDDHDDMLQGIKKSLYRSKRVEAGPSAAIMDVHRLPSNTGRSTIQDLVSALGVKSKQLKTQVKQLDQSKSKVLPTPSKLTDAKAERITSYERTKRELDRWHGIVEKNRLSENISFPMEDPSIPRAQSAVEYRQRLKQNVDEALKKADSGKLDFESRLYSRIYGKPKNEKSSATPDDVLDSEKIQERLTEKRKQIARQHFLEVKLKRQSRIKSKTYRRHQRKSRLKEELAELEALKASDPEAFMRKLEAVEKQRAEERSSQRHRGGSKFARMQKIRARYDDSAREAVQEMIAKSKELTEKVMQMEDEDSTDDEAGAVAEAEEKLPEELLLTWNKPSEAGAATSDYQRPKEIRRAEMNEEVASKIRSELGTDESEARQVDLDLSHVPGLAVSDNPDDIDSMQTRRGLFTAKMDQVIGTGEEVADFEKEKRTTMDAEQPKDIDMFLPGWNSWTGPGTAPVSEAKRQKFLIKAPKVIRQDASKKHVIISEHLDANRQFRQHLVKDIPFPHNNAAQFEDSLRQPVCRDFNTQIAHKRLTAPRVSVASGRIIEPMRQSHILRKQKRRTHKQIISNRDTNTSESSTRVLKAS